MRFVILLMDWRNKIITGWSDEVSVIRQDEIVEGALSRNGLTRAAVNKKKPPSGECLPCNIEVAHFSFIVLYIIATGWSDGESEGSEPGTIDPTEHSCPPTILTREQHLQTMLGECF